MKPETLQTPCEDEHQGYGTEEHPTYCQCNGTMLLLTEHGNTLLEFLTQHVKLIEVQGGYELAIRHGESGY